MLVVFCWSRKRRYTLHRDRNLSKNDGGGSGMAFMVEYYMSIDRKYGTQRTKNIPLCNDAMPYKHISFFIDSDMNIEHAIARMMSHRIYFGVRRRSLKPFVFDIFREMCVRAHHVAPAGWAIGQRCLRSTVIRKSIDNAVNIRLMGRSQKFDIFG